MDLRALKTQSESDIPIKEAYDKIAAIWNASITPNMNPFHQMLKRSTGNIQW
jgi:hypothetical protein